MIPTRSTQINHNTNFVCPEPSGIFPNLNNCRQFWHCSNNYAFSKDCPGNLVFDSNLKICTWTSNICKNGLFNALVPETTYLNPFPSQISAGNF